MSEAIANRTARVQTLVSIILRLHRGQGLEDVRRQLLSTVDKTDASEILAMEQCLLAEGVSATELTAKSDLHLDLLRGILVQRPARPALPDGHPADTFRRENIGLRRAVADMRKALLPLADEHDGEAADAHALRALQALHVLMDVEKHFRRKEKLLLPALAAHGFDSPSHLMTAMDDEVLARLLAAAEVFRNDGATREPHLALIATVERSLAALEHMIEREDDVLLPVALDTLTAEEWAEIWRASPAYGWCLVQPGKSYLPAPAAKPRVDTALGPIELDSGRLTPAQLRALFSTLPVDLTFVDEDDRVAFFNEGGLHIFSRTQEIIGRKVQFCHPVGSINLVDKILSEFRSGTRDVAEFWIELEEKFVHIRFFAVRDERKRYLGALEFVQDIAPMRKLQGNRRLLDEDPLYVTSATHRSGAGVY